jgi:protein TonB
MEISFDRPEPTHPRRFVGVAVVVLVHALVFYALVSGLARTALTIVQKPLEATIVQEIVPPPPPPPPPPKPVRQQEAPRVDAPPPPYVPPPEVATSVQAESPISIVSETPPAQEHRIEPAPAPALPPPAPAAPTRADIGVACPTQVRPEVPARAIQDGIAGTVRAQILIRQGVVKEVRILSGPRAYHQVVRAAVLRYGCVTEGEVVAQQEFEFRLE